MAVSIAENSHAAAFIKECNMYRLYDTFEKCCYTTEEAENVKKRNPTAPPERWLFVAVHDDMPEGIVHEELVVASSELRLDFVYSLDELGLSLRSIWDARIAHAKKHEARIVRVASVAGNKKTIESLLGCRIS